MEPFYQEPMATIYCGDALEVLKELPDESAQMAMTSPPYWGLRNYAGGTDIVWGQNGDCEHEWGDFIPHPMSKSGKHGPASSIGAKDAQHEVRKDGNQGSFCSLCGSWRGQLGLEPTPELYVAHLMMIFQEVKRVLRKDGAFYLNIGDTYGGSGSPSGDFKDEKGDNYLRPYAQAKLTPKCMTCIPERVLFAMLEDGWILRNKIIWHKPNSMPKSVKSRFTDTWEYLYFFTKNNKTLLWRNRETGEWRDTKPTKEENYPHGMRDKEGNKHQPLWGGFSYYFELDAVRQPHKTLSLERYQRGVNLGRPAEGKSGEVGPMQQYERAPQWFKDMYPPDSDYKGKFDELFGHGPNPQSFNLRVRDVKRGKKGTSAQGGELKASEKEIEEYEYPEKHHGSSMNNQEGLHTDRQKHEDADLGAQSPARKRHSGYFGEDGQPLVDFAKGKNPGDVVILSDRKYDSKYLQTDYGQPLQGFQRDQTIEKARDQSKKDAERLYPDDPEKQQKYINFIHDHQSHPKGKNSGDFWSITTKPSSISVCPQCDAVFPRLIKVCPNCKIEGVVGHFAPYPETLCIDPIKASSREGDVILDMFAGGGSTGIAAKRLGRRTILIDCVRPYCVMAKYKLSRVEYQPELV